jgi:excinuclease UvrABC nuclease subunit
MSDIDDIRQHLPEAPGLYFVYDNDELLYIGYAKNIRQRWRSHHRLAMLRERGGTYHIECEIVTDVGYEKADDLERRAIETYAPTWNNRNMHPTSPVALGKPQRTESLNALADELFGSSLFRALRTRVHHDT